jgi:glycosyltransferase involved in cell wall biosynthesis
VLVNGFPRLSETFVLQELLELERRGARLHVVALRRPDELVQLEQVARLRADVEYLPTAVSDSQTPTSRLRVRLAHAALCLQGPPRYLSALGEILAAPDFSRSALRASVLLAHRLATLGSPPLYVHFAHKSATIGRFAARLAGVPFGLSAHAKDIWLTPRDELARKVREAAVVLTCTSGASAYLGELAAGRTPVKLVYHGVDVDGLAPRDAGNETPVIACVGRLVEKKGHATLLHAAGLLSERGLEFRLRLAGEGPEWAALQRLAHQLGIGDRVVFLGPLTESEVRAEYERADVFALACQELTTGDRDGIPNVILEAMACGLPVVSTACGGVAEAVVDGVCGLLVPQRDAGSLANAVATLLEDFDLRRRLGGQARDHVVEHFDRSRHLAAAVEALCDAGLLPQHLGSKAPAPRLEAVA